jgi:hypothetical protein
VPAGPAVDGFTYTLEFITVALPNAVIACRANIDRPKSSETDYDSVVDQERVLVWPLFEHNWHNFRLTQTIAVRDNIFLG